MGNLEIAKKAAAYKVIDKYLKDNSVIGIGSGATVAYAVERLAERVKNENLSVICIPGSFTAKELILNNNLVLGELENHPEIDFTIDGADEVDEKLNAINAGGGHLLQTKIVASCSKELIIITDSTKSVKKFGGPSKKDIALEVIPWAHLPIREKIEKKFGGIVKLRIAPNSSKLGPVVTYNGNFILDWNFPNEINDWEKINTELLLIPGLLETGILMNLATKAYFGIENGDVKEQLRIQL